MSKYMSIKIVGCEGEDVYMFDERFVKCGKECSATIYNSECCKLLRNKYNLHIVFG